MSLIEIYVLGEDKDTEALNKLVKTLKCIATKEQLLEYGFTNFHKPNLYYCKRIDAEDKYPVSFSITLSAKTLKIKEIDVFDEMFGQPHFTNKDYNSKIKEIIGDLKSHKLFKTESKRISSKQKINKQIKESE